MSRMNSILSVIIVTAMTAGTLMGTKAALAETPATSLTLQIDEIEKPQGKMMIALFDSEDGYEGNAPVNGVAQAVSSDTVSVTFENLVPGAYGIKLYHDVNDNGDMDTNPFGMPVEPFAFSNNAQGRFGPAKWDKASFEIEAGQNAHLISLN